MGDPRSDDAWITDFALAAGAGDRAALVTFVRATQRDVYRFLTHLCERGEAEDLSQETYLRALRALPSFAGRSSARTWLLSIARRVAADQVRRTMTRPRTVPIDDWDTEVAANPLHRRSEFDEGMLLRELVARLQPDRRGRLRAHPDAGSGLCVRRRGVPLPRRHHPLAGGPGAGGLGPRNEPPRTPGGSATSL